MAADPIPVVLSGNQSIAYSAVVSVTRPNDTTAYAISDVLGSGTQAGGGIMVFPNMGPPNGRILITSVSLLRQVSALVGNEANYRLHLYNASPLSALGDNGAWDLTAGDLPNYVGYIDMGTPIDWGSNIYVEANGYNKQVALGPSGNLFGYLTTVFGYTPVALTVLTVTLHSQAL